MKLPAVGLGFLFAAFACAPFLAQADPASSKINVSSQINCPQHFGATSCGSLGTTYQKALSEGQSICQQRYDSSDALLIKNFQSSLTASAYSSIGSSANGSSNSCVNTTASPLSSTQTLSTGNDILNIVSIDPALSGRMDRAISVDTDLMMASGLGSTDPGCKSKLSALRDELKNAKSFSLESVAKPANKPQVLAVQASSKAPAPLLTVSTGSVLKPGPLQTSFQASLQAPLATNSNPAPQRQTPLQNSGVASAPPSGPASAPAIDGAPSSVPIFDETQSAQSALLAQQQCAAGAYKSNVEQKQTRYESEGFFGKLWSHLVGGVPPHDAQAIIEDPETAYEKLTPEKQAKYLSLCEPVSAVSNPSGAPASLMGVGGSGVAPGASGIGGVNLIADGSRGGVAGLAGPNGFAANEPWPPQCVINTMTSMAQEALDAYDKRGFFSKIYARLSGNGPPSDSKAILADPQAEFGKLSMADRVQLLSSCQHEIPSDQWAYATAQTQGRFVIPDYVKQQDLSASALTPSSAGGASWPPACALYAMTDQINALKVQDEEQHRLLLGGLIVGLEHIAGQGEPAGGDEILKDPRAAFVKLSPDDQSKFMKLCLLQKDAAFGLAGASPTGPHFDALMSGSQGGSLGGGGPLPASAPPQCALDAMTLDLGTQVRDYDRRGFISKDFVSLFGNAPPEYAKEALADPAGQFKNIDPDAQVKYLRSCLPCPPKQPEPGAFTRIRNWFQHLGWFGKTLTVLGSAVFGALIWRIRGGWLPTGSTQAARGIAAVSMGLLGFLLGGPAGLLAGLLQMPALFIGWSRYLYAAKAAGTINYGNLINMSIRGLEQTLGSGIVLAGAGFSPWFIVSGLAMGPIYSLSNLFLGGKKLFPDNPGGFITNTTTWAECFTGAWLFGALAATLLAGNGMHAQIVSCIK